MKFTLTIEGDTTNHDDARILDVVAWRLNKQWREETDQDASAKAAKVSAPAVESGTDTPVNGSAEIEAAPAVEPAPGPVEAEKPKRRTRKTKEPEPKPEPAKPEPTASSELDDMLTDDAPAATVDDVVNALRGAIEKHGVAKARDVLAEFKAGKVADLKPEVYGAVLAKLAALGRA